MALAKYLQHYAEPESLLLNHFPHSYQRALAIPMYRESKAALDYFCGYSERHSQTLLIVVINRPDSDHDKQWAQSALADLPAPVWSNNNLARYTLNNESGLLVIDRCINAAPIPQKQGVGLARKIANDVACRLIQLKLLASPWIFNTDADARLPENFFAATAQYSTSSSAILFPFQHSNVDGNPAHAATQIYELSLHYYVEALRWAESQYAYHSLGSIIAVNYQHYAINRGFPKRAAGEDFYLLNKLAKTGTINSLQQPTIKLLCRQSNRVPFGTGPAVSKIIQQNDYDNIPFYSPVIFHYLKTFQQLLQQLANQADIDTALHQLSPTHVDKDLLKQAAAYLKLDLAINHAYQQATTTAMRCKHLAIWFDAFKTLKLLHFIRDKEHAMIPYKQWQQLIKSEPYYNNLPMLNNAYPWIAQNPFNRFTRRDITWLPYAIKKWP